MRALTVIFVLWLICMIAMACAFYAINARVDFYITLFLILITSTTFGALAAVASDKAAV